MQPERAEILRSITRILEQDGYITKEEAVGIMELIQERSFGASGEDGTNRTFYTSYKS